VVYCTNSPGAPKPRESHLDSTVHDISSNTLATADIRSTTLSLSRRRLLMWRRRIYSWSIWDTNVHLLVAIEVRKPPPLVEAVVHYKEP